MYTLLGFFGYGIAIFSLLKNFKGNGQSAVGRKLFRQKYSLNSDDFSPK